MLAQVREGEGWDAAARGQGVDASSLAPPPHFVRSQFRHAARGCCVGVVPLLGVTLAFAPRFWYSVMIPLAFVSHWSRLVTCAMVPSRGMGSHVGWGHTWMGSGVLLGCRKAWVPGLGTTPRSGVGDDLCLRILKLPLHILTLALPLALLDAILVDRGVELVLRALSLPLRMCQLILELLRSLVTLLQLRRIGLLSNPFTRLCRRRLHGLANRVLLIARGDLHGVGWCGTGLDDVRNCGIDRDRRAVGGRVAARVVKGGRSVLNKSVCFTSLRRCFAAAVATRSASSWR